MRPRLLPCWLAPALLPWAARARCPAGFDDPDGFPPEWDIPIWPNLPQAIAANMRIVTMGGFKNHDLNDEYLEGPTAEFRIQGRESYWEANGQNFLYYCRQYKKWRIAHIAAFSKNKGGECFGMVSDALEGRDIQDPELITDWNEVVERKWVNNPDAGVEHLGTLGEQMREKGDGADEDEAAQCQRDAEAAGQDASNCPVMPVVRKVGEKVKQYGRRMGDWIKRLFPRLVEDSRKLPGGEDPDEDPQAAGAP